MKILITNNQIPIIKQIPITKFSITRKLYGQIFILKCFGYSVIGYLEIVWNLVLDDWLFIQLSKIACGVRKRKSNRGTDLGTEISSA